MPYKNKEDRRKHDRERYAKDSEFRKKTQEATAAWEESLPNGKWYTPEYGRKKQLERRHKITPEQYDAKLAEQGGHCALCLAKQGDDKRRMAVDHNHACCDSEITCGKCNRGILCADCNRMLGTLELILRDAWVFPMLGRDQSWVAKALRYIQKYEQVSPS
jgi:hypothetical protein